MQIGMSIKKPRGLGVLHRALAILRRPGIESHVYMSGAAGATLNGLQSGNYTLSDGSTGYAAVDGPAAGLVLDAMGTVGSELSPTFGSTLTATSTTDMSALVVGGTYRVTATVVKTSGTQIDIGVQNTAYGWQTGTPKTITANGTTLVDYFFVASDTLGRISALYTSAAGTVTLLSCKQVTGIHATQPTTANKPTERRGLLNLLAYSSDQSSVGWTKNGATTPTATRIVEDSGVNTQHYSRTSGSAGSFAGYMTLAVECSAAERSIINLYIDNGAGNSAAYDFDMATQAFTQRNLSVWTSPTTSFQDLGGGRYLCTLSATRASADSTYVRLSIGKAGATFAFGQPTYTGDGVSGLNIFKAALFQGTLTAQQILDSGGIPLTTTAAASNPTAGRYSWSFDGGDSLALGSVPFQMADDYAIVLAFTPTSDGVFAAFGPIYEWPIIQQLAGNRRVAYWDGTSGVSMQVAGALGQPCVVGVRKIGNTVTMRVNGAYVDAKSVAAITGNASVVTIGSIGGSGSISQFLPLKGTLSDSDMLTLERFAASTLPNSPSF